MKIILVDVGTFYTKVYVLRQVQENDGGNRTNPLGQFYGRGFFPTLVQRAGDPDPGRRYYEHEGERYAVGYDCSHSLRGEQILQAFEGEGLSADQAFIILKKILFDYADPGEALEIKVVVDSFPRAQVFEEIREALQPGKMEISAFRGYDKRRLTKEVTIRLHLVPSGEAVGRYLKRIKMDWTTALVADIGFDKTKLYVVDGRKGVELFQIGPCGISFYYEKIVHLLGEENLADSHFLWLVKQIELGCEEIEVRRDWKGGRWVQAATRADLFPRQVDISLVLENVRWDLNKEFHRFTTDALTAYYTNRVEWPALLVVTGGGASLNGELLRLSLEEGGYCFQAVHIEKQPLYAVLEGAGTLVSALMADGTPI